MGPLTESDVEGISEKAMQPMASVIKEALADFLSGSLVLDQSGLSEESLYKLHLMAEVLSSLDVLESEISSQPIVDLAVGMLMCALFVDEQSPCDDANKEGRSLRESFKGHVIVSVKERMFHAKTVDAFEACVRDKLVDCARSNPELKVGVAQLLSSWEQLAEHAVADSERRTDEYFSQGDGAAMVAEFREMDEEIETSANEVVPQAVEIVSSLTNKPHWDNSLESIDALVRGQNVVHLSLSLVERRIDSFAYTQYLYALTENLAAEGFQSFVFEEKRFVPPTILRALQDAKDERSLQTIADLTAEYLNTPLGSGIGSLRSYLMLPEADLDPHTAAWLSCAEELRNRFRRNNISVSTAEQYKASPESAAQRTVHFHGGLTAIGADIPFIRVTPLDPEHGSAGLNAILHKAVDRAARRDGFGDLSSVGVSQPHIHDIFKLTSVGSLSPSEGEHYRVASCCDINLWVFVAVDGEEATDQDAPVDIDTNAPVPVGR
jgi:hypothetical protein